MSTWLKKQVVSILEKLSLSFLYKKNYQKVMNNKLQKKIRVISKSGIGKKLGIQENSLQRNIPLTNYAFYRDFFINPKNGYFMYPLTEYLNVTTSGTMGNPKKYLLPKKALIDNTRQTGLATLFLATHNGEKTQFEWGDTFYMNIPGGSQISNYLSEIGGKQMVNFLNRCPDSNLSFHSKVEYFIKNYANIDIAYMNVPTFFDDIYPNLEAPLNLKGFMTNDISARIYSDEIKKATGSFPKVAYGSTETLSVTVPSIEYPGGFIFDWRVLYPEFIPEDQKINNNEIQVEKLEFIPVQDVESGKKYRLIVSPYLSDLHRYVMPDIMECIALGDDVIGTNLPVFKYQSRADRLVVLHNFTRINEEELINVLKDAKIPWVEFTSRIITEDHKDYLKLYIELSTPITETEFKKRFHSVINKLDNDWHDLVEFMGYIPLKVEFLPKGTFKKYLETKKESMYRVERIGMKDEWFKKLIKKST